MEAGVVGQKLMDVQRLVVAEDRNLRGAVPTLFRKMAEMTVKEKKKNMKIVTRINVKVCSWYIQDNNTWKAFRG